MKNKLNIILILSCVAAILSSGGYFYFLQRLESNRETVVDLSAKAQTFKLKLNDLQTIESNLKTTVESGNKISNLFLKQDSIVDFIQVVENLIKDLGVTGSVDSVVEQTNPVLEAAGKEKINMVISAQGDWSSLVSLLGLFERLPYKSTINSFSLRYEDIKVESKEGKKVPAVKAWNLKIILDVWAIADQDDSEKKDPKKIEVDNDDLI